MTKSHARDDSIDRLLRQSLKTPGGAATPACLDAETLAAWFDGGLKGAALENAQAHAAECARCRAVVAALARTSAAVPVAEPKASGLRWLRWAAPLSAAAAAAVLYVVVFPGRPPSGAVSDEVQQQAAAVEAPEAPPQAEALQAPASPPAVPATEPSAAPAPSAAAAPAPAREEQAAAAAPRADALRDGVSGRVGALAAVPPAPAEPAGTAERRQAFDQASAPANALAKAIAPATAVIVSPSPAIRWRLAGSTIERSTDSGATWSAVFTEAGRELVAGSAPSATTCWVVGRGGTVLRSTDGQRFTRLAFLDTTDLTAVQASDARSASVTTADGRVFATSDGGATWALQ